MTPASATQQQTAPPNTSGAKSDMTHVYLRDMYLKQHRADELAYSLGKWHRYRDGIWESVEDWQIKNEILFLVESEAKQNHIKCQIGTRLLNGVYELIRLMVTLPDGKFDADPNLIVFKNCALRISNDGQHLLENHTLTHYATTRFDFDYDPDATCQTWMSLLDNLDPNVVPFLQEFVGYSLTTDTKYEVAIWIHGLPGGGKSTFLNGITNMMGSKAGVLDLPNLEKSTFALTNIIGKTIVVSAEQPSEFIRSTSVLNRLISGEQITVDLKFRDPIVIKPHSKIIWAMNELPRIKEAGSGLFRRIKMIEFPEIPLLQRDPNFKEYRIPLEAPGIFNWALAGLDRLNKRGRFVVPDVVVKSTDDFKTSNDVAALFLLETYERDQNAGVYSSLLYQEYRDWCFTNGHTPASSTSLARDWKRLGLIQKRDAIGVMWKGIKVKP